MKCHECISFTELGGCRNGRSGRKFVGWFQEACQYGEPKEAYKNKNQDTMKENETNAATRVCKDCGRELPLEEFQKSRWGYTHYCKECFKKKQQAGSAKPAGTKSGTKPEQVGTKSGPSRDQVGTKSPAEKLEEMYRKEEKPELPIRRKEFAHVATGAVHLESDEIVELMTCLALELRERGYEVTGTICHKIEI